MIVTEIIGGLGNQMFQYACGKALAARNNVPLKLDYSGFKNYHAWNCQLDIFRLSSSPLSKAEELLFKGIKTNFFSKNSKLVFREDWPNFHSELLLKPQKFKYLRGYWQSEDYFKDFEKTIRKDLEFKEDLPGINIEFLSKLKQTSNAVSIHVRRGDYLKGLNPTIHGTLPLEYYRKAIDLISVELKSPTFFIFSDSPDWCKEHFKGENFVFVDFNNQDKGFLDMVLMKHCMSHITANSTFSWWGAWLSQSDTKITVMPKQWMANNKNIPKKIYPPGTIIL